MFQNLGQMKHQSIMGYYKFTWKKLPSNSKNPFELSEHHEIPVLDVDMK